jgi:hypothetical protein
LSSIMALAACATNKLHCAADTRALALNTVNRGLCC